MFGRVGLTARPPAAGGRSGAASRKGSMSPGTAPPARLPRNSAAASTAPIFWATAAAIHWFRETPSSLASRCAAAFTEAGSLRG